MWGEDATGYGKHRCRGVGKGQSRENKGLREPLQGFKQVKNTFIFW
jgi:hypothetical protein